MEATVLDWVTWTWKCVISLVKDFAPYAPVATAFVAFGAACIAWRAVRIQRVTATRRAAVDVFLKTEMDKGMLDAWDDYEAAIDALKGAQSMDVFAKTKEYKAIRKYLNIHELIAVGVQNGTLDGDVCYYYWSDILANAHEDAALVIKHVQSKERGRYTYIEMIQLNEKWKDRKQNVEQMLY